MSKPSNNDADNNDFRKRVIGLGNRSFRKNYFPQLKKQVRELQQKEKLLEEQSLKLTEALEKLELEKQKAQKQEQNYREIYNSTYDAILIHSREDGVVIDANKAASELLGYSHDEIMSLRLIDLCSDIEDCTLNRILDIYADIQPNQYKRFEWILPNRNGDFIQCEITLNLTTISNKDSVMAVIRDISDKKKAEELLTHSEEKYRLIVEKQSDMIVKIDTDGKFLFVSPSYCKMFDKTEEELIGNTFIPLVHDDDREHTLREMEKLCIPPHTAYIEQRAYTANGWKWLAWSDSAILDNHGNIKEIIGVGRDITAQRSMEEKLKITNFELERNLKFTRVLIDAIPIPVFYKDRLGRYIGVNKAFCNQLGVTSDQLIGKTISEIWPANDSEFHHQIDLELIRRPQRKRYNYQLKDKLNNKREVIFTKDVFYDEMEVPAGIIGTFIDVTEQHQYQEQLEKARAKAEESDKLKSAFLANMSHEIRTPMNGIIGFSELLLDPDLDSSLIKRYIDTINRSSRQLLQIVNDIIDISKIEVGQIELMEEHVDITSIMLDIQAFFDSIAVKDENQILVEIFLEDHDTHTYTDPIKLSQILTNLVNNALKFTQKGTVRIGCSLIKDYLEFYVADTGIGIPESALSYIFERFRQVDDAKRKKMGGTGLGLSISKAFVKKLGGDIWVESTIGKGSTFYFTIPRHRQPQDADPDMR